MNLFFAKAKAKATPRDSIVKLKETLQMLEKRQSFLETKAENEYKIAKLNATKNKRGKARFPSLLVGISNERSSGLPSLCDQLSGSHMNSQPLARAALTTSCYPFLREVC